MNSIPANPAKTIINAGMDSLIDLTKIDWRSIKYCYNNQFDAVNQIKLLKFYFISANQTSKLKLAVVLIAVWFISGLAREIN